MAVQFGEKIRLARETAGLTQRELAARLGVKNTTVSNWEKNLSRPDADLVVALCRELGLDANALYAGAIPPGFEPMPPMVRIPLIGQIACGEPILAESNFEAMVDAPAQHAPDFALRCRGDSMTGAGINDGDLVYIHCQPQVENGQIAAVRIGDEATLKRVYFDGETVTLVAANPAYAPMTYRRDELDRIHVEGKAVGFTHWF